MPVHPFGARIGAFAARSVYKECVSVYSFARRMSAAAGLRCAVAALSLLGALLLVLASVGGAGSAAAAAAPRPVILSVTVSTPHGLPLPASGARVVVSARVRNATSCTFFRQRSASSSLYRLKTVGCASGHASVTVPPIANHYKRPVRLTYAVRARGAGTLWTQRRVSIAQAASVGRPPPTATPSRGASTAVCSPSPCTAGSVVPQTISVYDSDGAGKRLVSRTYYLDRPNNLTNSTRNLAPLLVVFGGHYGTDPDTAEFHTLAASERFVVVTIEPVHSGQYATPTTDPTPTRAAFLKNCGQDGSTMCDDNPLVKAVLDKIDCIGAPPCENIDPTKVYMTGGSRGGLMTMTTACDTHTSHYFTAAVVVSMYLYSADTSGSQTVPPYCPAMLGTSNGFGGASGLAPNSNMAMAWFYGDNDSLACVNPSPQNCLDVGSTVGGRWRWGGPQNAGDSNPPSPSTRAGSNAMFGHHALGCSGGASTTTTIGTAPATEKIYTGCTNPKRATETIVVHGGGHSWPGIQVGGFDPHIAAWTFFSNYGGK